MKMVRFLLVIVGFLLLHGYCQCQVKNDTIRKGYKKESPYKVDSLARKKHDPRKATLYSTFVPGLGQIYNRKYWKLPLVYAAVGIPAYTFFYNRSWYQKCQQALTLITPYTDQGLAVPDDVTNKLDPRLRTLSASNIRTYRNEFRKDQDYSVIFFLLFWGLQIVDATVDAHLMSFDVSSELSMHLQQPSGNLALPASGMMGIGLAFDLHKPRYRPLKVP
jgi:hypothetical protein